MPLSMVETACRRCIRWHLPRDVFIDVTRDPSRLDSKDCVRSITPRSRASPDILVDRDSNGVGDATRKPGRWLAGGHSPAVNRVGSEKSETD